MQNHYIESIVQGPLAKKNASNSWKLAKERNLVCCHLDKSKTAYYCLEVPDFYLTCPIEICDSYLKSCFVK